MINTTASTLRAILAFIDPNNTPKIAYDKDEYAIQLAEKIKESVGDKDGSQRVCISFDELEEELQRQFTGVCLNIKQVFDNMHTLSLPNHLFIY